MFPNEYNQIIREHFDISDTNTRRCIIALEDAEQSQLLSALSNALYDKIIAKVDKIDFGTIPNSRGDITKVDGFENTVECLNIIRKLVLEYRENPQIVDTVLTAIENIKSRKAVFMKAYALNIEFPMVLYNLIVMSIEQSVSFLISVCIQYIKDPATQDVSAALDKVAYNNTMDNLLYEQLYNFNKACISGDTDNVLNDIMSRGGKLHEGFSASSEIDDTGAGVNTIVINVGKSIGPKSCGSPFQKFEDDNPTADCEKEAPCAGTSNCDNGDMEIINGSGDCTDKDSENIQEGIIGKASKLIDKLPVPDTVKVVAKVGAGAGILAFSLKTVSFLLKVFIPILRSTTYFLINSYVKFGDCLATQAQFIEANAYKLQYSTVSMDDEKKAKTVKKQLKIAERLKAFSNKIAIDNKKAEKKAKEMAKEEAKKVKIEDLEKELPVDIATKSILF